MRFCAAIVLALCAACGFRPGEKPPSDAAIDAVPDAPPAPVARRAAETVAGAGRVTVGAITIDVEIGQGVPVKQSTAGAIVVSGAPVVKP